MFLLSFFLKYLQNISLLFFPNSHIFDFLLLFTISDKHFDCFQILAHTLMIVDAALPKIKSRLLFLPLHVDCVLIGLIIVQLLESRHRGVDDLYHTILLAIELFSELLLVLNLFPPFLIPYIVLLHHQSTLLTQIRYRLCLPFERLEQ